MLAIASFIIYNLGWQARSGFLNRLSEMPQFAQVNSPRWHSYTLGRFSLPSPREDVGRTTNLVAPDIMRPAPIESRAGRSAMDLVNECPVCSVESVALSRHRIYELLACSHMRSGR